MTGSKLTLKAVLILGTCLAGFGPGLAMAQAARDDSSGVAPTLLNSGISDGAMLGVFAAGRREVWIGSDPSGEAGGGEYTPRIDLFRPDMIGKQVSLGTKALSSTVTVGSDAAQSGPSGITESPSASSGPTSLVMPAGHQLPTGGQVVFGGVSFDTSRPDTLGIVQSTDKAITSWATFDIGAGYNVAIRQPNANSAMLARVRGDTPSLINGQLSANGQVVLVNPNGIAVGAGGRIDTGSFVASTLDIADADFLSGNLTFRRTGKAATVVNQGTINAATGAALVGSGVVNEGAVSARLGRIGYGAGDMLTVDFAGDQFLSIAIPVSDAVGLTDVLGRPLAALVTVSGTTRAEGGQIYLSAQVARDLMLGAVKIDGDLVATTVREGANGRISLGSIKIDGGDGAVQLGGTLNASGSTALTGGKIAINSENVAIAGTLNASGGRDGGRVTISGDVVSAGGVVNASGGRVGGKVTIEAGRYAALTGVISATGMQGGNVTAHSGNHLLSAGTINASGNMMAGGNIALSADHRVVATSQSVAQADGVRSGGEIIVKGGTLQENAGIFTSGAYSARALSGIGGTIRFAGADIDLVAAYADASGGAGGGTIMVGYTGDRAAPVINALSVDVNAHTKLIADGGARGNGGLVALWSKDRTTMQGDLTARGGANGGNGGFLEVSSRGEIGFTGLADAGAPTGEAGTFLLDPKNIVISATAGSIMPFYELINPNPSMGSNFGPATILATGNVLLTDAGADIGATNTGAVYLFNLTTGALISQLSGTTANDAVGNGGVTALSNGNFVVQSSNWDNGATTDASAITWGSGTTGITGVVSASNSLVGTNSNDQLGSLGITELTNGNFVVISPKWGNNRGAVTWGSGTQGVAGAVSATNSLVGATANDEVGSEGVTVLTNGNYVVSSTKWSNSRGAVTWGSGINGVIGLVTASNSLVGSRNGDSVGFNGLKGVTALNNGNYVVSSTNWFGNRGAATWGNGTSGTVGEVSAINSLVGSQVNDFVGNSIVALSNGNYVVNSHGWNNGVVESAGAVTWGSGSTGIVGTVSVTNSLVGTTAGDRVGLNGVTALTNGNYVVMSPNWGSSRGAVTWGSGTLGVVGAVSATNSLVGASASDEVGSERVTVLTNGNYVVSSTNWSNGRGAVTWGSGLNGVIGLVTAGNSLVGTIDGDRVGLNGVTALTNGHYVVNSARWGSGRGAATWGSGTIGIAGQVSAGNSLVGGTNDFVGSGGTTALTNGNYVVMSFGWSNSRGAATWGNGTTGIVGTVSAANSLVGTTQNDKIGFRVTALTNGNYVVSSEFWGGQKGAVTWGNGTTGIVGEVSAANSLVGTRSGARGSDDPSPPFGVVEGDSVGRGGVTALTNGNYVVNSSFWNDRRGAATWGNGTSGVVGEVSAANSLVGARARDRVGIGGIEALPNGNYVVKSLEFDGRPNVVFGSGPQGAVTWGHGTSGIVGVVSNYNSLIGGDFEYSLQYVAAGKSGEIIAWSGYSSRTVVGLTDPASVTFSRALGQTLSIHPDFLTRTLNTGSAVTLQASNDITIESDIIVNNTSGNGGWLTLQAGRSLIVKANITTDNGNLTLVANERAGAGVVAADRDAGAAELTMASGVTINAGTGAVNLRLNDGGWTHW
jgi:filamentous hemagglutinin family protein